MHTSSRVAVALIPGKLLQGIKQLRNSVSLAALLPLGDHQLIARLMKLCLQLHHILLQCFHLLHVRQQNNCLNTTDEISIANTQQSRIFSEVWWIPRLLLCGQVYTNINVFESHVDILVSKYMYMQTKHCTSFECMFWQINFLKITCTCMYRNKSCNSLCCWV